MTAEQRYDDPVETRVDPMAQVAADIAEADEKIRRAREEATAARRAAGRANRYRASVVVHWLDREGRAWRGAFGAKMTIPFPTLASLEVLTELLLNSFHSVGRAHLVRAVAVTQDPETGHSVLALNYAGPTAAE